MVHVKFNDLAFDSGPGGIPVLVKVFSACNGLTGRLQIPIPLILKKLDEGSTMESLTRNSIVFSKKDVRAALVYATMNLQDREEFKRNKRYRRTNILLDENLSFYLIPELSKELSNLSHIYFEGMSGYTDEFIYWRPTAQLKEKSTRELRESKRAKNIIISQDSDLSDIARAQWMARVKSSSDPENIDFSDVNTIFHVRDINMGKPENGAWYLPFAKEIMKAAYSHQASSYIINRNGVSPEPGCSKAEIIAEADRGLFYERIRKGEMSLSDISQLDKMRSRRESRRTPSIPALVAA